MFMKKSGNLWTGILFSLALVCSMANVPVSKAEAADKSLPFTLKAPTSVSVVYMEGGDYPTAHQLSYSMDQDQLDYMIKADGDSEWRDSLLQSMGYSDLWIHTQMDWAIDDPVNGWHYTKYWDTNGYDENENYRMSSWDGDFWTNPLTTNDAWVLRYPGNLDNPEDAGWYGNEYIPGVKDQLKEDQYEIRTKDDEKYVYIDWSKHTLYVRVRWNVAIREDSEEGIHDSFIVSDWSEVAASGKDAKKWVPYTEDTLPAPEISNLQMTEEGFNGEPVVSYDLKVSDELAAGITEVAAHGGTVWIEVFAKPYGTAEWTQLQGDFQIQTSTLKVALAGLVTSGQAVGKNTPIEFRARYYCSQYDYSKNSNAESIGEIYSDWSNILKLNADLIPIPSDISTSTDDTSAYAYMTEVIDSDNDIKNSTYGTLKARQASVSKENIALKWESVKGAVRYAVYGNKCGKTNGVFNKYVKLSETTEKTISYIEVNGKKILPGTYYKFLVMAVDAENKILKISKTIHIVTDGGECTNLKSVSVAKKANAGKLTLKKGKSFALKAASVKTDAKKKVNNHRKIQYESSNTKIATVSSTGVIKAKKKGSCTIYAYAQNGVYKKITVKVNK